jgi:ribose transport system ATP-binding protein
MNTANSSPLLEVRDVCKSFPGVRALNNVSLRVGNSEILSVVGENGAGKSTLMKILAGVQRPDSGQILVDADRKRFRRVSDALDNGIALIHQELNLADNLSIAANIFLGREPVRFGMVDNKSINDQARELLRKIGLNFDPRRLVRELAIGQQQMVEIVKALSINARVLIMDEPTSSLSTTESQRLFQLIRNLQETGVSIVYISHRLKEVQDLSDRVTVLRDGENAGDLDRDHISHDSLVRLMVGRDISQVYSRHAHKTGKVALELDNLVTSTWPGHPVSFKIRAGEIVGLAGLVGAGRTELLRTIFGIDQAIAGSVRVAGTTQTVRSPKQAIQRGVALVPEDRKSQGVILEMSIRQNIGLASLKQNARTAGFLNFAQEFRQSKQMCEQLQVKTPSDTTLVGNLSGGNQQKIVLGKWLSLNPRVLMLDEPSRGIDVGAKQEIYQLMDQLAGEGIAILFASGELEEIIGLSDRALVMHEGRITGELSGAQLTEEAIMQLATGGLPVESACNTGESDAG